MLINTAPTIALLKPKPLHYFLCLFLVFLSYLVLNPSAELFGSTSKYFQNLTTSHQLTATSCPPWIIANASNLVSRLPFLHHFGLSSIWQPEGALNTCQIMSLLKTLQSFPQRISENRNPAMAYKAPHYLSYIVTWLYLLPLCSLLTFLP